MQHRSRRGLVVVAVAATLGSSALTSPAPDDPDDLAVQPSKPDGQLTCPPCLDLEILTAVEQALDELAHIEGASLALRNELMQVSSDMLG